MAIAQGISKITVIKKQTDLGVPASGSGGQIVRRESSANTLTKDTYTNNEIASHQQSTGKTHGLRSANMDLGGVLSPGTYAAYIGSVLRKDFVAGATATGVSVTIAGAGPTWTVTRAAGSYLSDGFKIGDVIRLTVGALNAANISKNLLITALSATVATVRPVNGVALVTEGPIATTTISVVGKKCIAPLTGHTRDYYTVEDWQSDISQSELFTDVMIGNAAIGLPSTGNTTIKLTGPGLNRSVGASQILTTPTPETTSNVLAAVNGLVIVNGVVQGIVNSMDITIDGKVASLGAVVGANVSPDIQRGTIDVTGTFTAFYESGVLPALFDAATQINLVMIVTNDTTAASDFISFSMSAVTLDGDSKDDGDKAIVRTYPFHARINGAGGAALANDKTIISIQDSLA